MKILHVICSFDSAELTERIYKELKQQTNEIVVLENSTTEQKRFICPETHDLGRENIGFGGMNDFIWSHKPYRAYDFVAIYNNDVYNLHPNWHKLLPGFLTSNIGMAAPAMNDEGTGWTHMRKKGEWFRYAEHVESAIGIFNTKLFDVFQKHSPMDFFGILDISLSLLSKRNGFDNIVIDALPITHELSGARKVAGVLERYTRESSSSLYRWHRQYPELQKEYTEYIRKYDGVSVIIPNYNHNHLLRRAVESVLRQKIKTEAVVIDDCSPNQDYSCIKDLPVTFIKHEKNKGLAATRNTGIKNCFHEWVLPLDADDEIKDQNLGFLFNNKGKGDIICGHCEFRNGGILHSKPEITANQFLRDNQLVGSSLYHKDVWRNINGYLEDHHTYYEDWCFWGRAAMRGYTFHNVNEIIYFYQGAADGMCAQLGKERQYNVNLVTGYIFQYKEWLEEQSNKFSNISGFSNG